MGFFQENGDKERMGYSLQCVGSPGTMIYEWRFFGLARLVSDDLCLLPSPSFGPGLGVRDWSNSPWSKLGIPASFGMACVRDWSNVGAVRRGLDFMST